MNAPTLAGRVSGEYGMDIHKIELPTVPTMKVTIDCREDRRGGSTRVSVAASVTSHEVAH